QNRRKLAKKNTFANREVKSTKCNIALEQGSASNLGRGPVFFLATRWRARVWVAAYLDAALGAVMAKSDRAPKRVMGDVILAFERLLSDSCYTNTSITSPGNFFGSSIKYLNNVIYPRASCIILCYLRPACLYFTCNKPSKTTMCLMFDCVRKVVDSQVCYSVKVSKFQPVSPLASR